MSRFPSSRAIEFALKNYLASKGRVKAYLNVQQMPGKDGPLYIVTTESALASLVQPYLEQHIGRACPYAQGSFVLHGADAERLVP